MASIDELWLIDFGTPCPSEPASRRPCVVLGPPDTFGSTFPLVIVAPLTTTWRGLSLHVEVSATPETGLRDTSYIQCELLRSINTNRLLHKIGIIDPQTSWRVNTILKTLLNH